MKCEKCGHEIEHVEVDMFDREGADSWCDYLILEHENGIYLDLDRSWTGYGLSDEERVECIRCPHCHQFPLICTEIQEYEIMREVMFTTKGK